MRMKIAVSLLAVVVASTAWSGCAAAAPAGGAAPTSAGQTAASSTTPSASSPVAGTKDADDCIPADVTAAGIPIVSGEVVCDLVRGTLADGTLSIVVKVSSIDAGFAEATGALEAAGYTAGVSAPEASNFSNGTYSVLLTVIEQAPYGPVATYVLAPA